MRITVKTDHPIASGSLDHTEPKGTAQDNSRNRRFNWKLYDLFRDLDRPMRVLDLGCAGGGFVRDCLYDGRVAVGIEGSDYSQVMGRAEWPVLSGRFLFTADITRPLEIQSGAASTETRLFFEAICLWEVLEHIADADLSTVFANIRAHLAPGGLVIASISNDPLPHHQTREDAAWWAARFHREGLHPVDRYTPYFGTQFVRGPKYGAPGSFHIIATNDPAKAPRVPAIRVTSRVLDRFWYGSRVHRQLRQLLGVE